MHKRLYTIVGGAALIATLAAGYGVQHWSNVQAAQVTNPPVITQTSAVTAEQRRVAAFSPDQETLAQLYDTASPSVVNIQVTVAQQASSQNQNPFGNLPFPFPFGNSPFGQNGPQQQQPMHGEGSGFVYDAEGHIVTNNHVVADADPDNIIVNFADGHWAKATLVATDPQADLAVLKVTAPAGMTLTPLPLAPADSVRVGYYVAAIGSPFGLDETMTLGVVSALDRTTPTGNLNDGQPHYSLPDVIQTDTAINPGNSGGPLLNMKGEVVGVNYMIESAAGSNAGVGFAIPVSVVEKVVPALIHDGAYRYAYLGISGQTINAAVAEEFKIADNTLGVYVGTVAKGGPAATAGVEADDIITAIDDQPVHRFEDLLGYLFNNAAPDQGITLHILRNGKEVTLDVTLGERPQADATANQQEQGALMGIGEALKTAKAAVLDGGLIENIDTAKATQDTQDGNPVWVITLSGNGKTAIVTIDAQSGEVLSLNVE
ncbi:MAG: trypsin-like peptidase domain-containing protein [Caldilineaceae bacterium]